MPRITKRFIESLKPGEAVHWDDKIPGFGVRVKQTGRRAFVIQYRNKQRQQRRLTLGVYGRMTVETARQEARKKLSLVEVGEDPAEQKRIDRKAETMTDLWDRYLAEYAEPHKKSSSVQNDRYMWNQDILPALGKRRVDTVTRQDIQKIHASLKDRPYQANRTLSLLSKIFGLAEEWGIRPELSNPCRGVRRFKEQKRERYLSGEEYRRLWKALANAEENQTEAQSAIDAIRLLILTGCRRDEILRLRWKDIDFERRVLRLQDSKTGQREVILNQAAVDMLKEILKRPIVDATHVCPGRLPGKPFVGLRWIWVRICEKAEIGSVRIHDLRHGFASVLAGAGQSLPIIGALLGHTRSETTARYSHLADDPVRTAANMAGKIIMDAVRKTG